MMFTDQICSCLFSCSEVAPKTLYRRYAIYMEVVLVLQREFDSFDPWHMFVGFNGFNPSSEE